jgi:hypothetical protein
MDVLPSSGRVRTALRADPRAALPAALVAVLAFVSGALGTVLVLRDPGSELVVDAVGAVTGSATSPAVVLAVDAVAGIVVGAALAFAALRALSVR